jgi:mono/diheme cytochrome c family protein
MHGYVGAAVKALVFCLLVPTALLFAQAGRSAPQLDTGEHIYKSGCITCHGPDGRGTPKSIAGFEPPRTFPDFTRCDQTTPEPDSAWKAVIVHGGPYRGFSPIMPAFDEALTSEQIDKVIEYMRGFCRNTHWARGELNLPRALVTEKAYPENELVVSSTANVRGAPGVESHIIHEQRFGMRNQIEVDLPVNFADQNHTWYGGVGDTTLGLKHEIFSSLRTGSIFSLQGSVVLPSGSRAHGFGSGTTTFETFGAFGQLFRSNTFLQLQAGAEFPVHPGIAPRAVFWNTALGQSFARDHGLGRLWSPMVEFVGSRDFTSAAKSDWDIVPQMQVTISRRQHLRGNLGFRVPGNNTADRPMQLMFYLLWDWGDGRLSEGW